MVRFRSLEEAIVYHALCLTWLWYAIGGLYILAPALAWSLLALAGWRALTLDPEDPDYPRPISPLVWIWIGAMLVMQLALVVGHLNFDLGIPLLIKSSIGWMKGWALLAIFPLIGATMRIRAEVLYMAAAMVTLHTLILVPIMLVAPMIGLPGTLFVSPLRAVGGPGPEFFEVQLYGTDPSEGLRWRFYTPWAPAAGVAYGMLCLLMLRVRSAGLKAAGLLAILAVAFMCKSRLGFVAIPLAILLSYGLAGLNRPKALLGAAVLFLFIALGADLILDALVEQKARIDAQRPDSTYVRRLLAQIALHRWETEAPIWGHGIVEPGPHLVEFMPIGSHHSWYGLLFVKGVIGFCALLVPLLTTIGELIIRAQVNPHARVALGFMLLFTFFTFTENVEILAYLIWPGLVLVGIASRQPILSPFARKHAEAV